MRDFKIGDYVKVKLTDREGVVTDIDDRHSAEWITLDDPSYRPYWRGELELVTLWMLDGGETAYLDIGDLWESELSWYATNEAQRWTVEQWSVIPPKRHLETGCDPENVLDYILEWVHESGELTDGCDEFFDPKDPDLIRAVDGLYGKIAKKVQWRQCNDLLSRHVITLRLDKDDELQPLLDGDEPIYRAAGEGDTDGD